MVLKNHTCLAYKGYNGENSQNKMGYYKLFYQTLLNNPYSILI